MPVTGAMRLGKHKSCFYPKHGVGDGLRCSPSGQQRGEGQSQGCLSGLQGSEWGSLASSVGPWWEWRQEGGAGASCPWSQGYQSTAPSRFP